MITKLNGMNFAYDEIGEGEPCLFLHGNRDRKEVFQPLVPFLKPRYHLTFLDLRGHGDTDKPREGFSYNQFLEDIYSFTKFRNLEPFNLIGHSLGGVLAVLYCLEYPQLVKRLVLMGTSAYFVPKFKRPAMDTAITKEMIKMTNENAAPYFFLPEFEDVQKNVMSNWSKVLPHVHENMIRMGHQDIREKVGKLKVPTLLVAGERDQISKLEDVVFMHERIPGAQLKVIKGTAHFMFMEKPREVSEAMSNFFDET